MKTEIILLIIAFQVVAGIMAKRKAKRAAEAVKNPTGQRPAPTTESRDQAANTPGKAAEMGKDLLSQLAKELGLEIPGQARPPAPAPKPQANPQPVVQAKPVPQPKPAARTANAAKAQATRPAARQTAIDKHAESAKRSVPARTLLSDDWDEGGAIGRSSSSSMPVTPLTEEAEVLTASSLARDSLTDADSIRRAFILKTILDKPLSLQPRRPGQI